MRLLHNVSAAIFTLAFSLLLPSEATTINKCQRAPSIDVSCPASNGVSYTPPGCCINGSNSFVISCAKEYSGRVLRVRTGVKDLKTCITQCTYTAACAAVSYDSRTKICLEKSAVDFARSKICQKNVVFAYRKRLQPALTTTSSQKFSTQSNKASTPTTSRIYSITSNGKSSSTLSATTGKVLTSSSSQKASTTLSSANTTVKSSGIALSSSQTISKSSAVSDALSSSVAPASTLSYTPSTFESSSTSQSSSNLQETTSTSLEAATTAAVVTSTHTSSKPSSMSTKSTTSESTSASVESTSTTEPSSTSLSTIESVISTTVTIGESSTFATTTELFTTSASTTSVSSTSISETTSTFTLDTTSTSSQPPVTTASTSADFSSSASAITTPISTTTSISSITAVSTTISALKTGETYTAQDGSKWRVSRGTEIIGAGTDIPGSSPVNSIKSFEESIEVCARQGTICRGVNYGLYSGSASPQAYLKQALQPNQGQSGISRPGAAANPTVDSAVRLTGVGGQARNLLQNGDFASGSMAPWTSRDLRSTVRDVFRVVDGTATTIIGSQGYSNAVLSQTFTSPNVGSNFFFSFDYTLTLDNPAAYCNAELDYGTTFGQVQLVGSSRMSANGIGSNTLNFGGLIPDLTVTGNPAGGVLLYFSCFNLNGGSATITLDNLNLVSYDPAAGDGSVVTLYRPLTNPSFNDSGSISPWNTYGYNGNGDPLTWTMTPVMNGIDVAYVGRNNRASIQFSQIVPRVMRRQQYSLKANIVVDATGSDSSIVCRIASLLGPNPNPYEITVTGNTRHEISVDHTNILTYNDSTEFNLSFQCSSAENYNVHLTITNLDLILNIGGVAP